MVKQGKTVREVTSDFHTALAGLYPEQEIRQLVLILFDEFLGWNRVRVHSSHAAEIPCTELNSFESALRELRQGKPVQYILRKAWFNDLILVVDPSVLIPRSETEQLCELIKAEVQPVPDTCLSILDIGTGSGCIAIDLKRHFHNSSVTALDSSAAALETARGNAGNYDGEMDFIQSDILNPYEWQKLGQYELIVSNPPYVRNSEKTFMHRNVLDNEPATALFVADEDPLIFYRNIAGFAAIHLKMNGSLYVEINEAFGREVCELAIESGLTNATVLKDLNGKDRFVRARRIAQ